jgi:hypothetical protein
MNKNTVIATSAPTSSVTLNVSAESVVAIYVSQHEDKLYDRQAALKKLLTILNKQLETTRETAVTNAGFNTATVEQHFGTYKTIVTTDGEPTVDFKKGVVTLPLKVQLIAVCSSGSNASCRTEQKETINSSLVDSYNQLLNEKQVVLDELKLINDDIINIGRNERKARAAVALKLLDDAGITDFTSVSPLSLPQL